EPGKGVRTAPQRERALVGDRNGKIVNADVAEIIPLLRLQRRCREAQAPVTERGDVPRDKLQGDGSDGRERAHPLWTLVADDARRHPVDGEAALRRRRQEPWMDAHLPLFFAGKSEPAEWIEFELDDVRARMRGGVEHRDVGVTPTRAASGVGTGEV